jgi:divalent metal cation (Fe/Co/Zn/Cd) transporter
MRLALRLEILTLLWMVAEAAVSLCAGIAAGSLLLIAFGADSVIELISASVLLWRLLREARSGPGDEDTVATVEQQAGRIGGFLLYALSAYVVAQALYGLTHRHHAQTSWWGLGVAVAAAFGMPVLARAKIRVADKIGSRALRADAMETFTCGWLAWMLLAGLAVNALLHWWWLDSVVSLMIVPFLWREAKEAITGECGCAGKS